MLLVLDRDPADVPLRPVLHVEAAEHQRRVADIQVGEPALSHVPGDIALEPGLVGAARPHVGVRLAHPFGRVAHRLQPGVRGIDVGLLGCELRVGVRLVGQAIPSDSGAVGGIRGESSLVARRRPEVRTLAGHAHRGGGPQVVAESTRQPRTGGPDLRSAPG